MAAKITLTELPAKLSATYQLVLRTGSRQQTHDVPEGEIYIGKSLRCEVRVAAPGVRGRHIRLKRYGDLIHIQAVGEARILVNGVMLDGLTSLEPGHSFTFGPVTAVVERIQAQD